MKANKMKNPSLFSFIGRDAFSAKLCESAELDRGRKRGIPQIIGFRLQPSRWPPKRPAAGLKPETCQLF